MRHSEQINEVASALAKAQGELTGATKNQINPAFGAGRKYADMQSVLAVCREPLSKNGLSVSQGTTVIDGEILLVTLLMHTSGQWLESVYPIRPVKTDPQGYGSAYTYGRRYSLMAIVGIAPEDDDGNQATGHQEERPEQRGYGNRPRRDRQPEREPNGHAGVNQEFSRGDEPRPSWSAFITAKLRDEKAAWMREMMTQEVPPPRRDEYAEITNEPRVVNHLVTRLIELERIDPADVSKDGRPGTRDATKAREVLVGFFERSPKTIGKAVDKYLAEKLRDARVALKIPAAEDGEAAIEAAKSKAESVVAGEVEGETWEPDRE